MSSLEAEETERLQSLAACMTAFEADPTADRIDTLLTAAFRSQITLMRASRVFPDRPGCRGVDVGLALSHPLTAALARQLHGCWKGLGVTSSTLSALLRRVVSNVGSQTRAPRAKLFVGVVPSLRRGVDPEAQVAFAAEGEGEWQIGLMTDTRLALGRVCGRGKHTTSTSVVPLSREEELGAPTSPECGQL